MVFLIDVMTTTWTVTPGCLEIDDEFTTNLNSARKSIKEKLFDKALERFQFTEWDKNALAAITKTLETEGDTPSDMAPKKAKEKEEKEKEEKKKKEERLKVFISAYKKAMRGILALAKSLHLKDLRYFFTEIVETVRLCLLFCPQF